MWRVLLRYTFLGGFFFQVIAIAWMFIVVGRIRRDQVSLKHFLRTWGTRDRDLDHALRTRPLDVQP